jgi:hypothetical protein
MCVNTLYVEVLCLVVLKEGTSERHASCPLGAHCLVLNIGV